MKRAIISFISATVGFTALYSVDWRVVVGVFLVLLALAIHLDGLTNH